MQIAEILEHDPITLALPDSVRLSDTEFFQFCQLNRDWRFEKNSEGEILIMAPCDWDTDESNAHLVSQLVAWAKKDGSGRATGPSAGYVLRNGAVRSPDAAWTRKARIDTLGQRAEGFLPLCPDFVVELLSPSDRLSRLQAKMQEYIDNGASLGWLIDRKTRRIHIYRPGLPVQTVNDCRSLSADPELPGFVLDTKDIWDLDSV